MVSTPTRIFTRLMKILVWPMYIIIIIQRRDGGCASLRPGFLSKNYTRGDEDEALDWQTEGARPRQLVPPASDA